MATEKNLFGRIQLRYDEFANWSSTTLGDDKGANLVLKAGEIGICSIPSGTTAEGIQNPPHVMFKVGDGTSKFSALPWTSAKAADVYAWAKQAALPVTKEGEGNVVSSIAWDEATKGIKFTTTSVATSKQLEDLTARVSTIETTYATDTDLSNAVNAINTEIGKKLDTATFTEFQGTNTQAIATAKSEAIADAKTETEKQVKALADGAVKANTDAIDAIKDGTKYDSFADVETAINGLGSAAYTESTAYATAAQGALADSALQKADITSGSANGTIAVEGSDVAVTGLGSAAFTEASAYDAAGAARAVQDDLDSYKTTNDAAVKAAKDLADANKAALDAFFNENAVSDDVVNTLKEIQEQLDAGEGSASSLLAEINKIKDGSTVVPKASHAVNADNATNAADSAKLGGLAAADYAQKSDLTAGNITVAKAAEASKLDEAGVAQVKGIKVDAAGAADTAAHADAAAAVDANGVNTAAIADKAVTAAKLADDVTTLIVNTKVNNAAAADNAAKLGGVEAANYALKTDAQGYADTAEANAKGYADGLAKNYATAAQGAKADSALQNIEVGTGLTITEKADNKQTIGIAEDVIFIINCGTASTVI